MAQAGLNDDKNWRSKISLNCPFKKGKNMTRISHNILKNVNIFKENLFFKFKFFLSAVHKFDENSSFKAKFLLCVGTGICGFLSPV